VKIYDITGRLIRTIENTDRWDGRDDDGNIVESGIYIYQFKKAGQRISGTIIVVK
jgi:flagellar hook assembly protein FlgD